MNFARWVGGSLSTHRLGTGIESYRLGQVSKIELQKAMALIIAPQHAGDHGCAANVRAR
jgi:hypothetical protein